MGKTGIIIANTGSPSAPTPDAVRAYLSEFLTDPRICPMNPVAWNIILKLFILPSRSKASARKYEQIWTLDGSPLIAHSAALANKLGAALPDIAVCHAMSYGTPSVEEALLNLQAQGCADITVIPLYPQSAFSTTKVVEDKVNAALGALGATQKPKVDFIESYFDNGAYLDAVAASIRDAGFTDGDALLMAFHSIPMKDVDAGDTYAEQVKHSANAIARRLGLDEDRWRVGFQSRFDNRKWVGPSTRTALTGLVDAADLGTTDGRLFVVAPNFSIDCLETIHDIEVVLRDEFAQMLGAEGAADRFVYVPCLNDSDAHVDVIRTLI